MNYIEAELRRQRALLSRLLLGVPAEAGAEEVISSQQRPDGAVWGFPAAGPAAGSGEAPVYGYGTLWPDAASARTTESLGAPSLPAALSDRATTAAGRGSAAQRAVSVAGGADHGRGGAFFSAREDASIRPGVVLLTAAGQALPSVEQNTARTVSLWAERDARRYDGGYTMY